MTKHHGLFTQSIGSILIGLAIFASLTVMASAQDFRIDTRVYHGKDEEPSVTAKTLFFDGSVYDILGDDQEIAIHDTKRKRFTLVSPEHNVRSILKASEIDTFVVGLNQKANETKSAFIRFMANPKFEEKFEMSDRQLDLTSPWVNYYVKVRQCDEATVEMYRTFADWSAKLNVVLNPGSYPPRARMKLNDALADHNSLPLEVNLSMKPGNRIFSRAVKSRSEHKITLGLSEADMREISRLGTLAASSKTVMFTDYQAKTTPTEDGY